MISGRAGPRLGLLNAGLVGDGRDLCLTGVKLYGGTALAPYLRKWQGVLEIIHRP